MPAPSRWPEGTCQQLARIGIWQAIADCATAIGTVHVSDRGHAGFVTLDAHDYRIEALGQVVELHDVGLRLFRLLQDAPGVTLHCPARVASFSRRDEAVSVTLDNGTTLEGQLLVAADGSRSAIATQCGVEWRSEPYGQAAVIANVSTAGAHNGRAFERFTEHGPLAMLPMSNGRCSLVWCHAQDRADEVLSPVRRTFLFRAAKGLRLAAWAHHPRRKTRGLSACADDRIADCLPSRRPRSATPRRRYTPSPGKASTLASVT